MVRRSLAAVVVLFVVGSLVLAGTYNGTCTKSEDGKITVNVKKDKKDKEGEDKKFTVNKETKYFKFPAKKGDDPTASDESAFNKAVKDSEKGVRVRIETEGEGDKEVVTKVTYGGKKGK